MLEKDIQKLCINKLEIWKMYKVVIHYENMSAHGKKLIRGRWVMHSNKGAPDLVAYIKYKDICGICFFEIKRPKGIQSVDQLNFMLKFCDISNVWYSLITDPIQIDNKLEDITGHIQDQFNKMEI